MITGNSALLMAQKFRGAEKQVSEELGGFYLFGLFEREQIPGRWDLVASAPWLKTDRAGTQRLIVALREKMNIEDWTLIGAVIPLEPSSPYVSVVTNLFDFKHQVEEVNDFSPSSQGVYVAPSSQGTYGIRIGHAFLITANRLPDPAVSKLAAA